MPSSSQISEDAQLMDATPEERFDQWRRRAARLQPDAVVQIMGNPEARSALYLAFSHADYLGRCCLAHPDAVITALNGEPSTVLSEVARDLRALDRATGPSEALARAIKPLKERAIVAIGLADITGKWSHEQVGTSLSDLSERILDAGLGWLTRLSYRHGEFTSQEDTAPVPLPGLFILGGGDFAGEEPSYCGPLEIALIYDERLLDEAGIGASERVFTRIANELVDAFGILSKQGVIFDLVPHNCELPTKHLTGEAASPFVMSADMVEQMLSEEATPFDRAWFASARTVAGDRRAGGDFIEKIASDIWRSGLKAEEIKQAVGYDEETGEASKSGSHTDAHSNAHWRLVQTCRLALGQHHDDFRAGPAREVFASAGRIGALDDLTAERLGSNYDFYAQARNRLALVRGDAITEMTSDRMIGDRAALCGFSNAELFDTVLAGTIAEAEQHWLNIVNEPQNPCFSVLGGDPSATGDDVSSTDVGKLEDIGFTEGKQISTTVDNWLQGDFVHGADAPDQRLSQLAPGLLTEFAATQEPDLAIANFDKFLNQLPPEQKPFDRLREDEALSSAVVDLFGNAPRFGEILANSPDLVKDVFDADLTWPENAEEWLKTYPAPGRHGSNEQVIEAISGWLWDSRARLCLGTIRGAIAFDQAGAILSAISEAALTTIYEITLSEVEAPEESEGKGLALIAMGDFGSEALSVATPLDLVFVYDPDGPDGPCAEAVHYYTDVAQKMTEILTEPRDVGNIAELPLFEIDTRCRPGGTSGEIASSVRAYRAFFEGEADAKGQLALTNARVLCGPQALMGRLDDLHTELLTRPRSGDKVLRDVDKARTRDARHEPPTSIWDVERIRGGYIDLKLIVSCLQTQYGAEHPYILTTDLREALSALGRARCLDAHIAAELTESLAFWQRLIAVQAFTGSKDPTAERPRRRLASLLAQASGVSEYNAVEPLIRGHAERSLAHYNHLILGQSPHKDTSQSVA